MGLGWGKRLLNAARIGKEKGIVIPNRNRTPMAIAIVDMGNLGTRFGTVGVEYVSIIGKTLWQWNA